MEKAILKDRIPRNERVRGTAKPLFGGIPASLCPFPSDSDSLSPGIYIFINKQF